MISPQQAIDCASAADSLSAERLQLLRHAERLYAYTEQLETFVREQSERLERLLEAVNLAVPAQDVSLMGQVGVATGDCDTLEDAGQLRRDAELLREAWRQLEAERRQLLTERQAWPNHAAGMPPPRGITVPFASQPTAAGMGRDLTSPPASSPPLVSHERKMLEFQQLRRDMQRKDRPPLP